MRDKVNDLALDLIMTQLVDMNTRATSLTDKEREFLIKAYQSTREEDVVDDDTDLSDLATEELLQRLVKGDASKTDNP